MISTSCSLPKATEARRARGSSWFLVVVSAARRLRAITLGNAKAGPSEPPPAMSAAWNWTRCAHVGGRAWMETTIERPHRAEANPAAGAVTARRTLTLEDRALSFLDPRQA